MTTDTSQNASAPVMVTQDEIDTYASDGVVHIKQPFEQHWIDGMIEIYERILRDHDEDSDQHRVNRAENGAVGIQNVILREPFYRKWAIESGVAQIVGEITQSSAVRFYFDNFFIKTGNDESVATALHHDVAAFGFKGTQLPSFWLALTDVDEDNAPLICALGSHKDTSFMWRSPAQPKGLPLLEGYREPAGIPDYIAQNDFPIVSFPAQKGDVIMVNPYLIHGSLPRKKGSGMRAGFSSRWMGDDVRWLPTDYNKAEASMQEREIPYGAEPPTDLFPPIWSQKEGARAKKTGEFTSMITLEPTKEKSKELYSTSVAGR